MLPTTTVQTEERVCTIASWSAQNDWQLTFDVGEIITVLDKFEGKTEYEGWHQGKLGDEIGLFPVSYTEPYKGKEFSVNPKNISNLVANLQRQCGFIKSEGIADLKREFNDLQKELAAKPENSSPVTIPKISENSREDPETAVSRLKKELEDVKKKLREEQSRHREPVLKQTGTEKKPDPIPAESDLKKEIEQLRKKLSSETESRKKTEKLREQCEEDLQTSKEENRRLEERCSLLMGELEKKDTEIGNLAEARDSAVETLVNSEKIQHEMEEKIFAMKIQRSKRMEELETKLRTEMENSDKDETTRMEIMRRQMEEAEDKHREERKLLKAEITELRKKVDLYLKESNHYKIQQDKEMRRAAAALERLESVKSQLRKDQEHQTELEKVKRELLKRTQELDIAKRLIEQTARIHLNRQLMGLIPDSSVEETEEKSDEKSRRRGKFFLDSKSDSDQVRALQEELASSQNNVTALYNLLEDERRAHQEVIDELTQKPQRSLERKSSKWLRKNMKYIPKAPAPPKQYLKITELEEQISEFSEIIEILVEDKSQLVEMNTQLLSQIRTFMRSPPASFIEFHMKEHVEKANTLTQELGSLKSQNEILQKKLTEQQKKGKDLEKILYKQTKSLKHPKAVPKQEETEQSEYQEHVIESQTNVLLSQLKELQAYAVSLGVTPKSRTDTKLITTERKLTQQLELLKEKLAESRTHALDLELELIISKEELQKYRLAMEVSNMIDT